MNYIKTLWIALLFIQLQSFAQTNENNMKKLIYVMDPQCGWCYGNSDNMNGVYNQFKDSFDIEILVGGLWVNENAPRGGDGLSQFIESHAPQMVKTTGAVLGDSYYELIKDSTYLFNSLEPSAAIVLIKEMETKQAFIFAKEVQKALYLDGKRLDTITTYLPILKSLNIDSKIFEEQWLSEDNITKTNTEFSKASTMVNGFPALILQDGETSTVLASGYFEKKKMVKKIENILEK